MHSSIHSFLNLPNGLSNDIKLVLKTPKKLKDVYWLKAKIQYAVEKNSEKSENFLVNIAVNWQTVKM